MRDLSGQLIDDGRYKILRPLDAGGMGAVWLAKAVRMDTQVVVKFPLESILQQEGFKERFQNEIRALIDLSSRHSNVVHILDVGEFGGQPYAVMQFLGGGSLKDWSSRLRAAKIRSLERGAMRWLEEISDALDFVHRRGLIHRDVKPPNILFDESRKSYLADFGIAKMLEEKAAAAAHMHSVTNPSQVIGTVEYMAPEVLQGKPASGRSDQYSLAVTLYHALAGAFPYQGKTPYEISVSHLKSAPQPLHRLCPFLPETIWPIVARAMSIESERRFGSCTEFAAAFLERLGSGGAGARRDSSDDVVIDAELVTPAPDTSSVRAGVAETAAKNSPPQPHPTPVSPDRTQVAMNAGSFGNVAGGEAAAETAPKKRAGWLGGIFGGQKSSQPTPTSPQSFLPPGSNASAGSGAVPFAPQVPFGPAAPNAAPKAPPPLPGRAPAAAAPARKRAHQLDKKVVRCPWCWHKFSRADILWIAEHPELRGDVKLLGAEQQRFLPEKFTSDCRAIDVLGNVCRRTACPRCHLVVPREFLDFEPIFLSVLGVPTSGKSCLLSSMIWQARQTLPRKFRYAFADADTELNQTIIQNEQMLFLDSSSQLVRLQKTDLRGDGYQTVRLDGQDVSYLRPFVFSMRPSPDHPNFHAAASISYALCIYDNAGEHFLPGSERSDSPVTRHLASSEAILFVFDPSQHPKFRAHCEAATGDPQFKAGFYQAPVRQETVLIEAMNRMRMHGDLSLHDRFSKPLVVLLNKYDAWAGAVAGKRLPDPWIDGPPTDPAYLDARRLAKVSQQFRTLLQGLCPEVVAAAENFSSQVLYLPASAFGRRIEADGGGSTGVRAGDLKPMWAEVPLLHALSVIRRGVIRRVVE